MQEATGTKRHLTRGASSVANCSRSSRVAESYRLVDEWIKSNGYERAGPVREVYAKDLSEVPPGILYAEIQIPVRRKGRKG